MASAACHDGHLRSLVCESDLQWQAVAHLLGGPTVLRKVAQCGPECQAADLSHVFQICLNVRDTCTGVSAEQHQQQAAAFLAQYQAYMGIGSAPAPQQPQQPRSPQRQQQQPQQPAPAPQQAHTQQQQPLQQAPQQGRQAAPQQLSRQPARREGRQPDAQRKQRPRNQQSGDAAQSLAQGAAKVSWDLSEDLDPCLAGM